MKRLVITDLHGRSPESLINEMKNARGISKGICLGDIESSEITEYLLGLGEENMSVIAGNHDYPFMMDCNRSLKGINLDKTKKPDFVNVNLSQYWEEVEKWSKSKLLSDFANKIIDSKDYAGRFKYNFSAKAGEVACVHASLFDDYDFLEESDEDDQNYPRQYSLWPRLHSVFGALNRPIISGNFEVMKDSTSPIWMMMRGHDWSQRLYSIDKESASLTDYKMEWDPQAPSLEFKLSQDKCYIASFGSYQQGQYGILDDGNMTLEFFNPGRKASLGN